jgi:anti-anti-sigma factor
VSTVDAVDAAPFSIAVVPDRREVIVALQGELDIASADVLRGCVGELRATGFDAIVVDLSGLSFIDSVGMQALLGLSNDAIRSGQELTLVPPAPAAGRIFDLTGTTGLFNWRPPSR